MDDTIPRLTLWKDAGTEDEITPSYYDRAGHVVHLSAVRDASFSVMGRRLVDNLNPRQYAVAQKKYKTVRDCLHPSQRELAYPDLTRFDWANISNHDEAYVCFALIFTGYERASDVMWWMINQGIYVGRGYALYDLPDGSVSDDFGLRLSGGFEHLPDGSTKNTWPLSAFERTDYSVSARFGEDHGMVSLNIFAHRMK